jgi:tetratricopeptide (TPR) repeat protein
MPEPGDFVSRFRTALDQLRAGALGDAAATCAMLRRQAPEDPAVLQLHATIELHAGRPAQAQQTAEHSLRLRGSHVPTLVLAARAARAAGAADAALTFLREAMAHAPDHAEPAFLLCRTLLDLDHPALAAALAQTAARHPAEAARWLEIGMELQRAGRPAAALAAFTQAATADPTSASAQFGRGLLLRDAGRNDAAHAALTQAVAHAPTHAGAWFALGLTCQDLQDEAGAASAFRAALREKPDFAEAAVNLGIALQRLGDMAAALDAYRAAVRIRPDTFGRIAQAMTSASTGMLCLDPDALRRLLDPAPAGTELPAVDAGAAE